MFAIMLQASLWPGTKVGTGLANVPDLISRIVLSKGRREAVGSAGKDFYRITGCARRGGGLRSGTYQSDLDNRIKGVPDIILMEAR